VTNPSDSSPEEFARLRGCLNDLVSVMGLPAVWGGTEPPQILATLMDALFGMLRLTFVLIRLSDPDGGPDRADADRVGVRRSRDLFTRRSCSAEPWPQRSIPSSNGSASAHRV